MLNDSAVGSQNSGDDYFFVQKRPVYFLTLQDFQQFRPGLDAELFMSRT